MDSHKGNLMECVHRAWKSICGNLWAVLGSQWLKYLSHTESLLSQGLDASWSSSDKERALLTLMLSLCVSETGTASKRLSWRLISAVSRWMIFCTSSTV